MAKPAAPGVAMRLVAPNTTSTNRNVSTTSAANAPPTLSPINECVS